MRWLLAGKSRPGVKVARPVVLSTAPPLGPEKITFPGGWPPQSTWASKVSFNWKRSAVAPWRKYAVRRLAVSENREVTDWITTSPRIATGERESGAYRLAPAFTDTDPEYG